MENNRSKIGKRSKAPPRSPVAANKRGGCRRWLMYGIIGFVVLMGCGIIANLSAPDSPESPEPARSAAVALPTWTATAVIQAAAASTAAPTSTKASTDAPTIVRDAASTAVPTVEPSQTPTEIPTTVPQPTATPLPTNTLAPATAAPTAAATPTATATTPVQIGPVANTEANVREGPGANYAVMAVAQPGQAMVVTGKDSTGEWLQLASGYWIAAWLVDNVPAELPVVVAAAQPVADNSALAPTAVSQAVLEVGGDGRFICTGGCAVSPDPSCAIKGNVNSRGDFIYHVPGGRDYNRTDIKPEEGDRWFCTEAEAQAAGFRAPQNQ